MLLSITSEAGQAEIARVIAKLYPNAHHIRHIDGGYENYIVSVDSQAVVRFPRTESVWRRSRLEEFVLSKFDSSLTPKVMTRHDDPPYLVQTFLPGAHLSEHDFRHLPSSKQRELGRQIAQFAYELHNAISAKEFTREHAILPTATNAGSYGDHLREILYDFTFPSKAQDEVAKQYYHAWLSIQPSRPVVIHDDLHVQNLLFDNGNLSGVLDFGAVCVGTVEQELRQVYQLSDEALGAAADTYQALSGVTVKTDAARTWAITQELATYAREYMAQNITSPAYVRAQEHLSRWFPEAFGNDLRPKDKTAGGM